ncbi:MAG: hypothetical protein GY888_29650, partial [Planctomycetaceae bacterium]|nr:hypothetical protein [Planctomycetaceae bacterium]
TAWHDGREGNSAWIAVFDHRLRPLGYRTWPFFEGFHGYLAGLGVGDIDADSNLELVTLSGTMSSPSFTHARSIESELIAWKLLPDDNGLRITKLDEIKWHGPRRWARPSALWLGELDNEQGIEIVTSGAHKLYEPWEDSISNDLRIWRFQAGHFIPQQKFEGFIWTSEGDIPLHYTDCNSIYGHDIDGDGVKELLLTFDMAGTNGVTGGKVSAMDPNQNFLTAPMQDISKRTLTYEIIWRDGTDTHLWNKTVSAADLAG